MSFFWFFVYSSMPKLSVKQHIIETASRLFYDNGYNLTGINEIIREAEVAKATLYNHFKSKDDICLAYLKHKNEVFLKEIKTFCSQAKSGKKQILSLFDFLDLFFQNKGFNGCWCINTVSEIPKENTKIRNEIKSQKKDFIEFIKILINNNFPNKSENEIQYLVQQVYLLYESALSESHLHQDSWPIRVGKDLCSKILN